MKTMPIPIPPINQTFLNGSMQFIKMTNFEIGLTCTTDIKRAEKKNKIAEQKLLNEENKWERKIEC